MGLFVTSSNISLIVVHTLSLYFLSFYINPNPKTERETLICVDDLALQKI